MPSNQAEQRCGGPTNNPRLIIGKCKPVIETGRCIRATDDSGCCTQNTNVCTGSGADPLSENDNKLCAGSCCDSTPDPENLDESPREWDDPCCNEENDESAPCADQCCGVGMSCPLTDACTEVDDARELDCGEPCCIESKEDGACPKSCCASECPATNACAGLDEAEELGCGGSCCGQEIAESTRSAVDGREPKKEDACQRSCCASGVSLPAAECEVVAVDEPKALAHASDSSPPLQTSTVRRRIAKQSHHHHHKGEKHHVKRRGHKSCAKTVFGRFYEVACCCVLNRLKVASSEALKRKQMSAEFKPPSKSLFDVERAGDDESNRLMRMSIQGMDCPACGKRVVRALNATPSVREPRVNVLGGEATLLYSDAVVTPAEIARLISTKTGLRCEAIEDRDNVITKSGVPASRIWRLKVQVNAIPPEGASSISAPHGVTIHPAKRSGKDKWILDVDYDPNLIQPRAVLANFAQFDGVHIPQPQSSTSEAVRKDLLNLLVRTVISIICCIPVLVLSWAPIPHHPITYGSINLVFTTIIQVYVAKPIYSSALRSAIFLRILDMDTLVAMSTSIAYIYSIVAFALQTAGHTFSDQFFETSALLVTLIMVGELVSAYAHRSASSALDDLAALQPREVILVHPSTYGPSTSKISEELVHPGDVLCIFPDTLVPTDGIAILGGSEVDESSITGESIPVAKQPGSSLIAGTLNLNGMLHMRITRVPAESTLADIAKLLRDTQEAAAALPVQDRADRAASYLAPAVLIISIMTFLVWMLVGVYVRHDTKGAAGIAALKYAITVMVIACPCAIVLAAPMVVVLAISVATKRGVLFKSAVAVQYAKDISVAVFDKTGTLTEGTPSVVQAHLLRDDAVEVVLALTSASQHPISNAVAKHLSSQSSTSENSLNLEGFHSVPGSGIEARYDDKVLRGGSPQWLNVDDHSAIVEMKTKQLTLFAVTHGGEPIAAFGLRDGLRAGAGEAVDMLQRRGIEVHIVSGDQPGVVSAIAANLKLAPERAIGGCKPQDKQQYVKALQAVSGRNRITGRVMFFGDGTNDSLALVQADIGVSLSSGTDVAMSAADIVYMDGKNLERSIRTTLDISEGAVRRIYGNFVWSIVYNTFGLLLASGAFVHARISPQYAGLGEMVSVLPVVLIAWSMTLLKK